MKIIRLSVENVQRLSAVNLEPRAKGLVIVAGKNGAGKTSVLDAITIAIAGADAIPSKPVRRGEDKATVELDLGELVVKRTMTAAGGTSLVVRNKDNQRLESPQAILDKLYGSLSFDPMEFLSMKGEKRSETLCALLGLDFQKEDGEIKAIFDERTALNRDVKALEARVKAVQEFPDAPAEEQSASAILEEQAFAAEQNRKNDYARVATARAWANLASTERALDDMVKQANAIDLEIERLQTKSRGLHAEIEVHTKKTGEEKQQVEELAGRTSALTDIDLAPFAGRISEVELINRKVRQNRDKAALRKQLQEKVKTADIHTKAIEKLEKSKRDKVLAAKFPVPGLSLSDTKEVLFNNLPFDQASTAEKLRVSVAMGTAMNPNLRVLLVRQGNDLDDDNLKLLSEMAVAEDIQLWLERVSTEGDVSVIIEDGHVAEPEEQKTV